MDGRFHQHVHVRRMNRADLPEVLALDEQSIDLCWNQDDYLRALEHLNCRVLVAEIKQKDKNKVVGVAACDLRDRTVHLRHITVAPEVRRRGIGSQLLEHMIASQLEPEHSLRSDRLIMPRDTIAADVAEDALTAQLFLQDNGFRATDVAKAGDTSGQATYRMERGYWSLERKMAEAVRNLERVTNIGWELAQRDRDGNFHSRGSWSYTKDRVGDASGLVLRTIVPLADAHSACQALNQLYEGAHVLKPAPGSEAATVGIPLVHIDDLIIRKGREGELAKVFVRQPPPNDLLGDEHDSGFADRERKQKIEDKRNRERGRDGGFTLLEATIVLVLVGLIVGGVLVGRSLIAAAELREVYSQYESIVAAVKTFQSKYDCLPGDCAYGEDIFGTDPQGCPAIPGSKAVGVVGTCNGDGDGRFDASLESGLVHESRELWRQLALADLLAGSFSGGWVDDADGGSLGYKSGVNCPQVLSTQWCWTALDGDYSLLLNLAGFPPDAFAVDLGMYMGTTLWLLAPPGSYGFFQPADAAAYASRFSAGNRLIVSCSDSEGDSVELDDVLHLNPDNVRCTIFYRDSF